jgi:hypothetical protein
MRFNEEANLVRSQRRPLLGRVVAGVDSIMHRSPEWRERAIAMVERFPLVASVAQGVLRRQRAARAPATHLEFDAVALRRTTAQSALALRARKRRAAG